MGARGRGRSGGRTRRSDDTGDDALLFGRRPVLELLKSGGSVEKVLIAQGLAASGVLGEIRRRAESAAVPVRMVPRDELEKVTRGANHQGVAAITGRYRYAPLEDLVRADDAKILFLDGVTDPHNLGSLLRSADSAGFHGIVIPSHRSVAVTAAVRRVSAGAAEVVPVARVANLSQGLLAAKQAGLWIVGLDAAAEADIYSSDLTEPPLGLVLGAEDRGISRLVRENCDQLVKIPQGGRIASLNVAVAGAVAMFEVARRERVR